MSQDSLDTDLKRLYAEYDADHDRLKRELMSKLPDIYPADRSDQETPGSADDLDLESWYAQFDGDHERLKQELMAKLPDIYPSASSVRPADGWFSTWSTSLVFRVAACLLIVAGAVIIASTLPRPAYALQDVLDQFLHADRLYLKGVQQSLARDMEFPVEIYIERPNTFWTTYFYRGGSVVARGYQAGNGSVRYLRTDHEDAPNWYTEDLPVWASIEAEKMVVTTVGEAILDGDASEFDLVRTESFRGMQCDVYDRRSAKAIFTRLYVDRATQSPVRALTYFIDKRSGQEKTIRDINDIIINPAAAPDHIRLEPPNLPLAEIPHAVERFRSASGVDEHYLYMPVVLSIDDRAALVCWSVVFPEQSEASVEYAEFTLALPNGTDVSSEAVELGTTNDGKVDWHWVLVKSTDPLRDLKGLSVHARMAVYAERGVGRNSDREFSFNREFFELPMNMDSDNVAELIKSFSTGGGDLSLPAIRAELGDHRS